MIRFEPFRAGHLHAFVPQPVQQSEYNTLVTSNEATQLEGHTSISAWSGVRCIGAAGLVKLYAHRALGWALLSKDAAPHMLAIVRKIDRIIAVSGFRRVEFHVAPDFRNGHRLMQCLGAVRETPEPMRGHAFDGGDEVLYAIVRN